eukprot:jgi/Bigna1/137303/aug1.38_g12011
MQRSVRRLYKNIMKSVPRVLDQYEFTYMEENAVRTNLKKHFTKHFNESNPVVIDMLRIKGEMELDETLRMFKTPCHIEKILTTDIDDVGFLESKAVTKEYQKIGGGSEFMASFYQGS